jgi:beta-N-acetylhexosaminidase
VVLVLVLFNNQETDTVINETTVEKKSEEELLNEEVEAELKMMTLDQKVAQLIVPTAPRLTISDQLAERLSTAPYGGFIITEVSFGSLTSTREFIQKLQKLSAYPLIISVDQEGGNVQRLENITTPKATRIPYASEIGYVGSMDLSRKVGSVVSRELSVVGFNVDYAPVMDVNSNPKNPIIGKRSFSKDPTIVSKMGLAFAEGLAENHVTAVYKHFPGHGNTSTDSHYSLPIIQRTRAELDKSDLVPFRYAIRNGAKVIMTGHIALPKITGDNTPATLSSKINTDILRKEFKYEGLIVSDGMNMGALANNYPETEIYYRAINAGIDMVVLPSSPEIAMKSIKEHVSKERIDESVYRILKFKDDYLKNYQYLDESYFGSAEHARAIQQIP